ncbi:MAG: hypothetical protein AAGF48_16020 [Pseudomonadota bacterium]
MSDIQTDDAPAYDVLVAVALCAAAWEPEVRIIGNVRAGDILRSCNRATTLLARHGDPYDNHEGSDG